MNKHTLRSLVAAVVALAALVTLGCSGGGSRSGYCAPYYWSADNSMVRISGSGANVGASSSAVKSAVKNGKPFTVTDYNTMKTYTVKLSSGAAADLNDGDPCAAIAEIMAIINSRTAGASVPPPVAPPKPVSTVNPADPMTTPTPPSPATSPTPITGSLTLYPGDYTLDSFKNATLTLARPLGLDARAPAVYVFHGLTLDGCTINLDHGQTVLHMDGNLTCTGTRWVSATPSVVDARNLLILGSAACSTVDVAGGQPFAAGIYAPAADVTLNQVQLTGGAVGRTVTAVKSDIRYDAHLRVVNYPGLGVASPRSLDEKME